MELSTFSAASSPNAMDSLSDIMFLLIKLERYAKLNIYGNKDETGKYDGFTDYDFDYNTVVNDLMINIDRMK